MPASSLARVVKRCGRAIGGRQHPAVVILAGLPQWECWWTAAARSVPGSVVIRATTRANTELGDDYADRLREVLSADEYEASVEGRPQPPVGQVLRGWRPTPWPDGNVLDVPARAYIGHDVTVAVDFGLRRPAAALIVQDETRGLDVILDDVQPDEVDVWELARLVAARIQHHGLRLSRVVGDPAGHQRSAMSMTTQAAEFVAALRAQLGACPPMMSTTEPDRRAIPSGLACLSRLIHAADGTRSLVVLRSCWERETPGRSVRSCVLGYRYRAGSDEPAKDGEHDHLIDALRYWAVVLRWVGPAVEHRPRDIGIDLAAILGR